MNELLPDGTYFSAANTQNGAIKRNAVKRNIAMVTFKPSFVMFRRIVSPPYRLGFEIYPFAHN